MSTSSSTIEKRTGLGPGGKKRRAEGPFFDRTFKYWALLPAIAILVLLTLYPTAKLLRMSVSEISVGSDASVTWEYVGDKHVRTAIEDPVVGVAIRNTLVFVVIVVICEVTLGLILALLISRTTRMTAVYRTIFLLPLLMPPIAIGTMWKLMYDYNYGLFNMILGLAGIQGPTWTADPNLAMMCIIIVDIWHWTSFLFLILMAGVESLPHELVEVARVDGATELQTYRYILLPLLRPTIVIALMLRTIFAFKVFDQIYLLTSGGPGTATEVLNLYIYDVFFVQFRMGYGSFLAIVLALMMTVFVIFYRWVNTRMASD
jgi:multiple sugar transport system permease protein